MWTAHSKTVGGLSKTLGAQAPQCVQEVAHGVKNCSGSEELVACLLGPQICLARPCYSVFLPLSLSLLNYECFPWACLSLES